MRTKPSPGRPKRDRAVTPASAIDALTGDPNFMTSLARGLAVIQGFTQQKRSLTIAQLSQRTGIPRAAVRRCLYTLGKLGLAASDDGKTFSLRPKILGLGHAYLSSTTLAMSAQPLLDRVSEALDESSSIALLDGDEILYVARSSTTRRIMSVDLSIGTRLPAYCTSMGRVLLAHLAPDDLDGYFQRVPLVAHTGAHADHAGTRPQGARRRACRRVRGGRSGVGAGLALDCRAGAGPLGSRGGGDEHQHAGVARAGRRPFAPIPARARTLRAAHGALSTTRRCVA